MIVSSNRNGQKPRPHLKFISNEVILDTFRKLEMSRVGNGENHFQSCLEDRKNSEKKSNRANKSQLQSWQEG